MPLETSLLGSRLSGTCQVPKDRANPRLEISGFLDILLRMDSLLGTLRALGDETRLRLLAVLGEGAFHVNELAFVLGLGQSRVSRHLKILLDAGLVRARREGSWVYYELSPRWGGENGDAILRELAPHLGSRIDAERESIQTALERRRERAEAFFRGMARRWDHRRDEVLGPPRHISPLVARIPEAETIVDLGTGTGVLLGDLSARAEQVIGVDSSAEMLEVARENARSQSLSNVDLRLGRLEHLPLADAHADLMVANMVLHHVARPRAALDEVHRGLKPDGRLVIADFRPHEREEYRELLGDLWLGFDEMELRRWVREAGFVTESLEPIGSGSGEPDVFLLTARKEDRERGGNGGTERR